MKRITMSLLSGVVAMAAFACSHDHMGSSRYGSSTGGGPGMESSGSSSTGGKWQTQGLNNGSSYGGAQSGSQEMQSGTYGTTGTSSAAPWGGQGGGPSNLNSGSSGSFDNRAPMNAPPSSAPGSSSAPSSTGDDVNMYGR